MLKLFHYTLRVITHLGLGLQVLKQLVVMLADGLKNPNILKFILFSITITCFYRKLAAEILLSLHQVD